MPKSPSRRIREQVVVYMDENDRKLLEAVVTETGLSRTELFRRGLRQIAGQVLRDHRPGSAFDYLVANARADSFPADVAGRHDQYLAAGGYKAVGFRKPVPSKKKRARPR